jgi:hypothetical protein
MKPIDLMLLDQARAEKTCLRSEAVRAILRIADKISHRFGPGEAVGAIQIALAIAERRVELKPSQSNEVLRDMRKSVGEALRRVGDEATATDVANELALLGDA